MPTQVVVGSASGEARASSRLRVVGMVVGRLGHGVVPGRASRLEQGAIGRGRRSVAVVGAVLAAAVRGELLDGAAGDDLVEDGLLVARLAEDPAEPLDVLADRARARRGSPRRWPRGR